MIKFNLNYRFIYIFLKFLNILEQMISDIINGIIIYKFIF